MHASHQIPLKLIKPMEIILISKLVYKNKINEIIHTQLES